MPERPRWANPTRINAGLAVLGVVLFVVMEIVTGRIPANEGRGFDGMDYAAMLDDLRHGTMNTALRPAIVVFNRPAFALTRTAVDAFRAMNDLYAGLVAWFACLLFDRYWPPGGGRAVWIKALLIANLFATIAVAKYAAFYPVLVDVGAMALILAAIALHVSGRRLPAAAVAVVAVLAREFALAVVVFGAVRDLRLRVPLRIVAATWLPAAAAFVGWRAFAVRAWSEAGSAPLGLAQLVDNLQYWQDPVFASLFAYFALTIFGGISLFAVARARVSVAHLLREPEWAAYALFILAAAAVGDADVWRYLAYLLPVAVVLFAVAARDLSATRLRLAVAAVLVCAATAITQRPLQQLDMTAYFLDWFPYYVQKGTNLPMVETVPHLWPVWAWRFLAAAGLLWVMMAIPPVSSHADRA